MRRVLLTGASGFIGRAVLNLLLENNYYVIAVGRNKPDIINSAHSKNYEWRFLDLLDEDVCFKDYLKNIHIVIHLAAQVHKMKIKTQEDLLKYHNLNTKKTVLLAEQAKSNNVQLFLFMSSVKVLGEKTVGKAFSSETVPAPIDPYGVSKLKAEQELINICNNSDMKYVVLRTPLVFGPGVKANFLKMIKIISKGYPLPFKSLKNKRSLIYIENLSNIILKCIKNNMAKNKIYLVKDIDVSTTQLIETVSRFFSRKVYLFPINSSILKFSFYLLGMKNQIDRLTDPLIVDDHKIRQDLGWYPIHSFEESIERTVSWYKLENNNY